MKTSRRLVANTLAAGLGLSLWGCSTGTPGTAPQVNFNNIVVPAVGFVNPKFDPTAGNPSEIPLPIDILRSSAADANLGLNLGIPDDGTDATRSIRTIRGFSTTGNILIPFDGQIQESSVNSQSVLFFEGGVSGTGADFTNTTIAANITVLNPQENGAGGASTIILQPQRPLRPGRDHFVVVTNQVLSGNRNVGSPRFAQLTKGTTPLVDGNGVSQLFPLTNAQAQQLEPLRLAFQDWWQRAEAATGRDRIEIPLVFRFGTQNLFPAMAQLSATARAETQPPNGPKGITNTAVAANDANSVDTFFTNNGAGDLVNSNSNVGRICTGRISPNQWIQDNQPGPIQPLLGQNNFGIAINPLDGSNFFQGTGIPPAQTGPIPPDPVIDQGDLAVPFIACLPATAQPQGGYPTVIFQHGLGRSKADVLRIADEINRQGFAVIAIDLWLHGELSIIGQASGTGFVNPGNLRMTRDNIRQSAGNLHYLTSAIAFGKGELDANTAGPELFPSFTGQGVPTGVFPHYIGQSLGGIVGTVYSATEAFNRRSVINVAGGRLTELLLTSPSLGPTLIAQLAANGLNAGTEEFRQFFLIAQTVLDDADPLNYAAPGIAGQLRGGSPSAVLVQEVIGDTVVGNSATHDLARAFNQVPGFRHVQPVFAALDFLTQAAAPHNGNGLSQVNFGNHGLLLVGQGNSLADALRVQQQAVDFVRTGIINAP